MLFVFTSLFLFLSLSFAQDIITVLSQQKGVSRFTDILRGYPSIVQDLNNGQNTVIIPSDAAISSTGAFNTTTSSLEALLRYHIIRDVHPSATFNSTPSFPQTWLTNTDYTNVTGGQRVELIRQNGIANVVTAIKAPSNLIQPDIFFTGGLIHIVDTPLTIPLSFPETITKAGLSSLVALLTKGGWLSEEYLDLVTLQSDVTVFGPDSSVYGANFQGFDNLTTTERDKIFRNALVVNNAIYSSSMTNTSSYTTVANLPLVITASGKDLWADRSYIMSRDYLTANGVLQVVDSILDPAVAGLRPNPKITTTSTNSSKSPQSLSTAAQVGLIVGAIVLGVGALLSLVLYCRVRRRRQRAPPTYQQSFNQQPPKTEPKSRSTHSPQSKKSDIPVVQTIEYSHEEPQGQTRSPEDWKKPHISNTTVEDVTEVEHSSMAGFAGANERPIADTTASGTTSLMPLHANTYNLQRQTSKTNRSNGQTYSPVDRNTMDLSEEACLPPAIGIAISSPDFATIQSHAQQDRNSIATFKSAFTTIPTQPTSPPPQFPLPCRNSIPSSLRKTQYYNTTPIQKSSLSSTSIPLSSSSTSQLISQDNSSINSPSSNRNSHTQGHQQDEDKASLPYTLPETALPSPIRFNGLDFDIDPRPSTTNSNLNPNPHPDSHLLSNFHSHEMRKQEDKKYENEGSTPRKSTRKSTNPILTNPISNSVKEAHSSSNSNSSSRSRSKSKSKTKPHQQQKYHLSTTNKKTETISMTKPRQDSVIVADSFLELEYSRV